MTNLEINIAVTKSGEKEPIEFNELSPVEQHSLIGMLEMQLNHFMNASSQPSEGLIQQQKFEMLALQAYHARQLTYHNFSKSLVS